LKKKIIATALSEEKIEGLWQAYQKHPSIYFVAAECKVSPTKTEVSSVTAIISPSF